MEFLVKIFIIIFIIMLIASAIIVSIVVVNSKRTKFLMENSVAIKKLLFINSKYKFYIPTQNYDEHHVYDNEKFFNDISCEDYLIYQLQFKQYEIRKEINNIKYNQELQEKYYKDIIQISEFGQCINEKNQHKKKRLLVKERILFNKNVIRPHVNFYTTVTLCRSNLNGYVYERKWQNFSAEEILVLIKRLNNKNRGFYNDRDIWDALCRVERGRVSNKMRFKIYERDGYRCCYCGRTQEEDFLEIDHIKPISKGGKSEENNLQTLCRTCNKNKGNTY